MFVCLETIKYKVADVMRWRKLYFSLAERTLGRTLFFCHIKICVFVCVFFNFGTLEEDETCSMTTLEEQ